MHASYKFCLFSLTGHAARADASRIGFFLSDITDLEDPNRVFALDPEDLARINPNTGTLPVLRTQRDADITAGIYRRVPVLWNERRQDGNAWAMSFKRLFDMTDDSDLFRSREELELEGWELQGNVFGRDGERMMPLYEAKMVDFFNHRAADVVKSPTAVNRQNQPRYLPAEELQDPARLALPLKWIQQDGTIPTRRNDRNVHVKGLSYVSLRRGGTETGSAGGATSPPQPTSAPPSQPSSPYGRRQHLHPDAPPRGAPAGRGHGRHPVFACF